MAKFLLCTDLDGTVLGDADSEAAFRAWAARMGARVEIAYITGRSAHNVRALIEEGRLPPARYAATAVGSEMYDLSDPENRLGRHYRDLADPAWPAESIRRQGHSDATPLQPEDCQGRFKASFFWDGDGASLEAFRGRLERIPDRRIIATAERYLDILPRCFSKGQALRFLAAASGLGLKHSIAAGDMEHDLDMFEAAGNAIIPSNALPAVKEASKDTPYYLATQPAAHGLLEGLKRLGLD